MARKNESKKNNEVEIKDNRILIDKFSNVKSFNANNIYVKSHCFKLESAVFLRNISFNSKKPLIETFDHCHIFHTYDSSGKELKQCNSVGGHYHIITLREENGKFIADCSTPICNKGSSDLLDKDKHTHNVVYLKSEEFQARNVSVEASQLVSAFLNEDRIKIDVSDAPTRE